MQSAAVTDEKAMLQQSRLLDGLYVVGSFERRVTLYSQQLRALNLVHALRTREILTDRSEIAIVGAGPAGLTAAAGAAVVGAGGVTVFECAGSVLHMWRQCQSRWFHPHLFDWPNVGWAKSDAGLPLLNWKANRADDVARQMEQQWKLIQQHYGVDVITGAEARLDQVNPKRISWGVSGERRSFDLVILAPGFGRDGKPGDEDTCYWANDNLEAYRDDGRQVYLISGCGDGGLADALRVRLRDYNMQLLTEWISSEDMLDVAQSVREIEKAAESLEDSGGRAAANDFLAREYLELQTPGLTQTLSTRLRPDTQVVLQGDKDNLFSLGSFPLNRLLVSRLLQTDTENTAYMPGPIENDAEVLKGSKERPGLVATIAGFGDVRVDRVIVRRGAQAAIRRPSLRWVDGLTEATKLRAKNEVDQSGRQACFPPTTFRTPEILREAITQATRRLTMPADMPVIEFFSPVHGERLKSAIADEIERAQAELEAPSAVYETEEDYLRGLMDLLSQLGTGGSVRALCGDKQWRSAWVQHYFRLNYDAVLRGVSINRIFLQQRGQAGDDQRTAMLDQAHNGVHVWQVPFETGTSVMEDYKVPNTFGFAIVEQPGVEPRTIIHDLSELRRGVTGVLITAPILVRRHAHLWSEMRRTAIRFKAE